MKTYKEFAEHMGQLIMPPGMAAGEQIYEILKECFGDWVLVNKRDGFSIASTEVSKLTKPLGTTWFKRVPRYIIEGSKEVLKAFLDSYILGDGSNPCSGGGINIPAATHGMADDLQEIAFRLGIRSSVKPSPLYWRTYLVKDGNPTVSIRRKDWKEIDYSGKVWCPTVSTGLFIARRKGWIFVTGNSEMTVPPSKHGKSFRWVESYAGFTEESLLLYRLYEQGVKNGRKLWPGRMYPTTDGPDAEIEVYVNDTSRMLCYWGTVPRCPDQKQIYYSTEATVLVPNEFDRVHRNQWVSNTSTFIPMEWWYACRRTDEEFPTIDKKHHNVIVSMDAAVTNDSFGIILACRHPVFVDEIVVLYSNKWSPNPSTHKIDFEGTDENPGPIKVVERFVKEYNVVQICYDPFQLHDCAMRMKKKGLAWMKEFNQQGDRARADSQLRDLIRDRRIWHRGDVDLTAHLQNANAKIDDQDSKIRLVKRVEHLKIDLAVALSMAGHELLRLNL